MKKGLFTALIAFWALLFTAASAGAFFVNGQIWNTHRTDGLYTNIAIVTKFSWTEPIAAF